MVWTTHMVVGATTAQLLAWSPPLALIAAGASHYVLDALPHWDYHLTFGRTEQLDKAEGSSIIAWVFDIGKVLIDTLIGLLLVVGVFMWLEQTTGLTVVWPLLVAGMVLAIGPDILQIAYHLRPYRLLVYLQAWHDFCHHPSRALKAYPLRGSLWQAGLVLVVLVSVYFWVGG